MKTIRKELYMMTQRELIDFIEIELTKNGIEFKNDKLGNIWSIRHKDAPVFIAHMDTVIGSDDFYKVELKEENGKIFRPGHVLGADDRAGVNLILNHKKKINFVLTVDEEVGAIGASALSINDEFINDMSKGTFFIELDRRGGKDVLGNTHGYCSKECSDAVLEVMTGFSEGYGVFTDIDALTGIAQGVNLSVGYHGAHTKNEYLNIAEFNYINSKIILLSKIKGHRATFEKPKNRYGRAYNYNYDFSKYYRSRHIDKCDLCGGYDTVQEVGGMNVCSTCLIDVESYNDSPVKCSCCGKTLISGESITTVDKLGMTFCDDCIGYDWA